MTKLNVELGENSYEILIGEKIFCEVAKFIAESNFTKKILIVTDSNVFKIYSEELRKIFTKCEVNFEVEVIPVCAKPKTCTPARLNHSLIENP